MPKLARLEPVIFTLRLCCCASHLISNYRLHSKTIVSVKNDLKSSTNLLLHEVKDLCNDLLAYLDLLLILILMISPWLVRSMKLEQNGIKINLITSFFHSSSNRISRNAFAIFWIKKKNLSFLQIGSLFKIWNQDTGRLLMLLTQLENYELNYLLQRI